MPLMEGGQLQDGHGVNLYSHIHGHHSERSSGAKTPKTPSLREGTPNYNEMYLSGRSSCERTPRVRSSSGEKTPLGYEQHRLLPPSGRSNGDKTHISREIEQRPYLNERNHNADKFHGERSSHKRERSTEGKQIHDADEDERYNQRHMIVAHDHGSNTNIVGGNQCLFQNPNKHQGLRRATSAPLAIGKESLSDSMDLKSGRSHEKHGKTYKDEASTEEDSVCSVFRGHWNSSPPGVKSSDLISNSQVSVVQRFVQAQAKALGKYNDNESKDVSYNHHHHDDWCSFDLKKPKSTKSLTQQKAVAAVLAFQRWRHTQLKKLFSMELKKVLEEAKEDEACLATLEKELAIKDKHLAQLRSQLAHYQKECQDQTNQRQIHQLLGANVQELEKECQKALERASKAEDVLRKRDAEVIRLRERLKSLEEEGVRLDSELQTNMNLLHKEKENALGEGRILLAQLTRRDEEVAQQCQEIEKLRVTVAQLSDRQINQEKQVDCMKTDHQAQVQHLQDKLEQAHAATHAKETEVASFTERCNGLGQERQNLLLQLHRAVERADLASRRAEELQMKLHCTSEERAKASEDIAGEMVEHLKRLTGHMKELETSVDRNGLMCLPPGAFLQKKAGLAKISTKLAQAELDALNLISHTENYEADHHGLPESGAHDESLEEIEDNKRQVCFLFDRKNRRRHERSTSAITPFREEGDTCNISLIDRDIALTKFKNWTAWKWRWAASAARADNLAKQLLSQDSTVPKSTFMKDSEGTIVQRGSAFRERAMGLVKKLESSQFDDLSLPDEKKVGALILKHKMVPLIMAAWRAFTRMSSLERRATSRNESLNKIISALPWWIRRVGERRLAERYFFHWQLLTLKATREKSQQSHKKKIVPYVNPIFQSRLRDREGDPPQAQAHGYARTRSPTSRAAPPLPVAEFRDVEVQTATGVMPREAEGDGNLKQGTRSPNPGASPLKAATSRFPHRAKSEPKAPVTCPTCDIRRKFSRGLQQQPTNFQSTQRADPTIGVVNNNSTFTARALRALQGSLQQELKELHYLLSQEMEDTQQIPVKAEGAEINRQALKSVFDVCNNLAQALIEVRSQLTSEENQVNTPRGLSPPPPTTPRTSPWGVGERSSLRSRYPEAKDSWEGGRGSSLSRDKLSTCRPSTASGGMRTPRYASPIGQKGGRFSSPGWHSHEKSATSIREPWSRHGSPASIRQLREREARVNAPSTLRELREFRARQGRQQQHEYENSYAHSGRQSPEDRDDEREVGGGDQGRQLRRESVVRFSRDEAKAMERDEYEDDTICTTTSSKLPPPPDYTTVVQILNQENTKIGEVAIHTSSVAAPDRPSDRGGIADLCSSARDAIRTEEQNVSKPNQIETHDRQHHTQQEQRRRAQQLAEKSIYKSSQANYMPKSALKSSARGHSAPRERSYSHSSVLKRPLDLHSRIADDAPLFSSLRRKQCIGSDYADLLKSEIVRLREGRLMIEDGKSVAQGEGGDATLSRELCTPRSSYLANRPSWRPHYTTPVRTKS